MGIAAMQNIGAAASGISQGLMDAYKIKRAQSEISKNDAEAKAKKDQAEYDKGMESIVNGTDSASPDATPDAVQGLPVSDAADSSTPQTDGTDSTAPTKQGLPTTDGSAAPDATAWTYNPLKYKNIGNDPSLGYFHENITKNQRMSDYAAKHGKFKDAALFRGNAERSAQLLEIAIDRNANAEERTARMNKVTEENITKNRLDIFDIAFNKNDPKTAASLTGGASGPKNYSKESEVKVDHKAGTVSYTDSSGQPVVITKSFYDRFSKTMNYGSGDEKQLATLLHDWKQERSQLKTSLAPINAVLGGYGPGETDAKKPELEAQAKEINDRLKELNGWIKPLDKQMASGVIPDSMDGSQDVTGDTKQGLQPAKRDASKAGGYSNADAFGSKATKTAGAADVPENAADKPDTAVQGLGVAASTDRQRGPAPDAAASAPAQPAATPTIAQPKTQEEFDALPSGAKFINPKDGKTYTKK